MISSSRGAEAACVEVETRMAIAGSFMQSMNKVAKFVNDAGPFIFDDYRGWID